MAKFATHASGAIWWPNSQLWWHLVAKFGTNASGILFISWRDNSSERGNTLGPLCLWQCLMPGLRYLMRLNLARQLHCGVEWDVEKIEVMLHDSWSLELGGRGWGWGRLMEREREMRRWMNGLCLGSLHKSQFGLASPFSLLNNDKLWFFKTASDVARRTI